MDTDRISSLVHTLSTTPSRRAVNRALVGLTTGPILASLIGLAGLVDEGEACCKPIGPDPFYYCCAAGLTCLPSTGMTCT